MKLDKETAMKAVLAAIEEVNLSLPEGSKIECSETAALYGEEGGMDSLTLVNLVSTTEQQLYDILEEEVMLASEAAMSRRNSPYRSVDALVAYAVEVAGQPS